MKPFELYNFICSLTKEKRNPRKLSFYLVRSKTALENLHNRGWDDEQIKMLVINTVKTLMGNGAPLAFQYIIAILCTTNVVPAVKSVEEHTLGYDEWINQERERVKNAQ